MYVELEETARQKGPRRVYNVDLQRDVGLSPRQIHRVPAEVVERESAGAGHLALARAQINVHLSKDRGKNSFLNYLTGTLKRLGRLQLAITSLPLGNYSLAGVEGGARFELIASLGGWNSRRLPFAIARRTLVYSVS